MFSSQNSQVSNNVNYIEDVFSTYLYTGTSATITITNNIDLAGKGGLVWCKDRSHPRDNVLMDTAQGINKAMSSNNTQANSYYGTENINSFNSTGFTLNANLAQVNNASETYVSWTFRKQPKFFDVVTFTGDGRTSGNAIINHNLGVTPAVIIFRQVNGNSNWQYGTNFGAANWLSLFLNLDNAGSTTSYANNDWFAAQPTSTTFTVGWPYFASGSTYVAYLFAHNAGGFGLTGTDNVISCGTFTTDGTGAAGNITLGYESQLVMFKRSDGVGNWQIVDIMRGSSLTSYNYISPTVSSAESSSTSTQGIYPTATGFYVGNNFPGANQTYIYIAIRRGPMKTPTLGTSVFAPVVSSVSSGTQITAGFPVDLQIFRYRAGVTSNYAIDRLRGVGTTPTVTSTPSLYTDRADAENSFGGIARNWDNTSFAMPSGFGGVSDVFWNFRRAPGFFDEVCYTGTGSATAQTHNLGAVPELMIVKSRSDSWNWAVYHSALGNTKIILLDNSGGPVTQSTVWNNTSPTSTNFSIGTAGYTNANTNNFVAYLFATCLGVSKVGSYTGTGALQTVACGFTSGARFVLVKRVDSPGDWYVWDSARGITSGNDPYLLLSSTAAEVTGTNYVDTDTTGFKVTAAAPVELNASGGTYIFLAIA